MTKKLSKAQLAQLIEIGNGTRVQRRLLTGHVWWNACFSEKAYGVERSRFESRSRATIDALESRGLIQMERREAPYQSYLVATLTDAGQKALEDNRG